ncbi:hypothetical protein DXG01_009019 [Tephrocybe rancida]|nr:hypothetical protein DXG01_009019 [Tephrocybe rancida]
MAPRKRKPAKKEAPEPARSAWARGPPPGPPTPPSEPVGASKPDTPPISKAEPARTEAPKPSTTSIIVPSPTTSSRSAWARGPPPSRTEALESARTEAPREAPDLARRRSAWARGPPPGSPTPPSEPVSASKPDTPSISKAEPARTEVPKPSTISNIVPSQTTNLRSVWARGPPPSRTEALESTRTEAPREAPDLARLAWARGPPLTPPLTTQQPHAQANASLAQVFPSLAQTNSARDPVQERVLQLLSGLTGTTVTISTKTSQRYEGVVGTTRGEGDTTGVTLKDVKEISNPGTPLKDKIFIPSTNIETWSSGPADAEPVNGNIFGTDTDTDVSARNGVGRAPELQQWSSGHDSAASTDNDTSSTEVVNSAITADIPKNSVNGQDDSVTIPSQTQSPSSSKVPSPNPNKVPLSVVFRDFVLNEKKRLAQKKQEIAKREMDKRVAELVTSSNLNEPSPDVLVPILAKDDGSGSIATRISYLLGDSVLCRALLRKRGPDAQVLLDVFQWLLDDADLAEDLRRQLIVATQRLSVKSGLYPRDVVQDSQHPVTGGGFADIYKGSFGGQVVCLKTIRVYQDSQLEHVLKTLDVANGLGYLHRNGIIHGDLKGPNILVDEQGRARLCDFGIASICDSEIRDWTTQSSVGSKGGSTRWQAPELHDVESDNEVQNTVFSDVYAFGGVCYQIFTGKVPFYQFSRDATVTLQVKAHKTPLRPDEPGVPWQEWGLTQSIWQLMGDCWKAAPEERPMVQEIIERITPLVQQNKRATGGDVVTPTHFRRSMSETPDDATITALDKLCCTVRILASGSGESSD